MISPKPASTASEAYALRHHASVASVVVGGTPGPRWCRCRLEATTGAARLKMRRHRVAAVLGSVRRSLSRPRNNSPAPDIVVARGPRQPAQSRTSGLLGQVCEVFQKKRGSFSPQISFGGGVEVGDSHQGVGGGASATMNALFRSLGRSTATKVSLRRSLHHRHQRLSQLENSRLTSPSPLAGTRNLFFFFLVSDQRHPHPVVVVVVVVVVWCEVARGGDARFGV